MARTLRNDPLGGEQYAKGTYIQLPKDDASRPTNTFEQDGVIVHTHKRPAYEIAPLYQRLGPPAASLVLLVASAVLCYSWWSDKVFYAESSLYRMATTSRNNVHVGIHILSSVLAVLWCFSVCANFTMVVRTQLARRSITLDSMRLYAAISKLTLEFSLPLHKFVICAMVCASALVPAWLWTGALTPQVDTSSVDGTLAMAKTGGDAYSFLPNATWNPAWNGCWTVTQVNGSFSSCLGLFLSAKLLESAGTAISPNGGPRTHSKPDNSGMQYIGRSYGVGSSVGLVSSSSSKDRRALAYNFSEVGYSTTAACTYNRSTAWGYEHTSDANPDGFGGIPATYYVKGFLPNANPAYGYQFAGQVDFSDTGVNG